MGILPAYGFFIRHAEGLKLNNISVNFTTDDQRPAFIFDDVNGADIRFIKAQTAGNARAISLKNSAEVNVFEGTQLA